MSARHSHARSIAAHAILILYTLIALFPVFVIVINSFKSRRAICMGYSNLYRDLAAAMGLEVEYVRGWSKGYGFTPGATPTRETALILQVLDW